MRIREAQLTDFDGIFRLYKHVAAQGNGIARLEAEITEGYVRENLTHGLNDGIVLVVEVGEQIVAEIHAYPMGIKIFEHVLSNLTIAIHPDFQGQGIGFQLFTRFLEKVENEMPHILRVELHARDGNEAAIRLYKKLGFGLEGYLKNRDKLADGSFYDDISFGWMNKNYNARITKKMTNYLKILDRYIIKKYLTTFGFVLLILSLIACVIDLGEKIEEFKKEHVSVKTVIFDYYLNFIPHINALLFPLIALISVVFFTSRMAYDSEIISILNAGVSFKRIMRPYLIAAGMIAFVHLSFNHYIVPNGNKKRLAVERAHVWKNNDKGKYENIHMLLDPKTAVFIGYYNKHDSTARDFRIEKYDSVGNVINFIRAETADFKGDPNKWQLRMLSRRTFSGLYESLETNIPKLDTTLALGPDDFSQFLNQNELLTTGELRAEIAKREGRGIGNTKTFEIEMHRRTADAFTIIILTLIGMAIAARKVRGGMGFHLALGIGIGAIYIVISKFSATFAQQPDVPTWLGVWIPNFIFGLIALFLVSRAQK